jgi:hypothetical protein
MSPMPDDYSDGIDTDSGLIFEMVCPLRRT